MSRKKAEIMRSLIIGEIRENFLFRQHGDHMMLANSIGGDILLKGVEKASKADLEKLFAVSFKKWKESTENVIRRKDAYGKGGDFTYAARLISEGGMEYIRCGDTKVRDDVKSLAEEMFEEAAARQSLEELMYPNHQWDRQRTIDIINQFRLHSLVRDLVRMEAKARMEAAFHVLKEYMKPGVKAADEMASKISEAKSVNNYDVVRILGLECGMIPIMRECADMCRGVRLRKGFVKGLNGDLSLYSSLADSEMAEIHNVLSENIGADYEKQLAEIVLLSER